MDKKYRLSEKTLNINGHILYEIIAIKDFNDVKTGDHGGFIEHEDNLNQYDTSWVYDHGIVYGHAKIYGNASVHDNACVCDNAHVLKCRSIWKRTSFLFFTCVSKCYHKRKRYCF